MVDRAALTEDPLFSIIMPCYNVASYLDAAIDAVQAQTCESWELILVDDGSAPGEAALLDARAQADPRIRVVAHEVNRGVAAARNTGLAHARGSYVWMADPDDRFDARLLEHVSAALETPDVDCVVFGCTEAYVDAAGEVSLKREVLPPVQGYFSGQGLREQVLPLEESTLYGYPWNKVYARRVLEGLRFENVPLIEDILFSIAAFDRADAAVFLQEPLYEYAKRQASNLTNRFEPRYYDVHRRRIEELYCQQRRWGADTPEVRSRLGSLYVRYIMSALERNCDPRAHMSHADRVAWCRTVFDDELFRTLVPGAVSRGGRALSAGIKLISLRSPFVACALGRVIHLVRHGMGASYAKLKMER